MIDFDALVIGPAMETFARPITIDPVASMPGTVPYQARGSLSTRNLDMSTQDGIVTDQFTTLEIRLSEFKKPPRQTDKITDNTTTLSYIVGDTVLDGQGGMRMTLRRIAPKPFPPIQPVP